MIRGGSRVRSLAPVLLGVTALILTAPAPTVNAAQTLSWAETPETLAILERHIPELQAALASQGLEAEGFELHLGFGDERSAEGADEPGSPDASGAAEDPNEIDLDPNLLARTVASRSGLDTYA